MTKLWAWIKERFKPPIRSRWQPDDLVWYGRPEDKPPPEKLTPEQEREARYLFREVQHHRPLRILLHGGPGDNQWTTITEPVRIQGVVPWLTPVPVNWNDPDPVLRTTTTVYRRHKAAWIDEDDRRRHVYDLWVAEGEDPQQYLYRVQEMFDA